MRDAVEPPLISVVVATYNSAPFLELAIRSALAQTHPRIEVIVADDASTDATAAIAARLAAADPRIRFLPSAVNGGPGATRNRALRAARGDWAAVLDSDDLIHPDRLAALLSVAIERGADIVADDLILFDDDGTVAPRRFLRPPETDASREITPARYLAQTVLYGGRPNLGFLKPLIRLAPLRAAGIAYDEGLRIGEDDDLVTQMLAAGMRYWLLPMPYYYYRKHGHSISHRTSLATLDAMAAAVARVRARFAGADATVQRAIDRRARAVADARWFQLFVDQLKDRRIGAALGTAGGHPGLLRLAWMPVMARVERLSRRRSSVRSSVGDPAPAHAGRNVVFISRQRITGRDNGSSTYLLDLADAVRAAGFVPHLLQPSPTVVGRRPVFAMSDDLAVFETHPIRGVWRVGRRVISRDPRVWRAAASGIAARCLKRVGIRARFDDTPFPHSITIPWTAEDYLFTAIQGYGLADAIVADYAFQCDGIAAVLRPDRPSAVVMHDLYAERSGSFGAAATQDSVVGLSAAREAALLGKADLVVAIQQAEAGWVERNVPDTRVVTAPMAAKPVAAPQPGDADHVMFVGSNTPPNVIGLEWFFTAIWPAIRTSLPGARLTVAGSIAAAFTTAVPEGVEMLGIVPDLAPLYAAAGVVISPLTVGSGLKIKLIDALAQGKAIVATSVTVQGVEEQVAAAVTPIDDPAAFATAIVDLLRDPARRADRASASLAVARRHFSPETCYGPFVDWLRATIATTSRSPAT